MDDFNTATLPHFKYYHYEQWEMEKYNKQQIQQQQHSSFVLQDEPRHRQELLEKSRQQKQEELELVRTSLNPKKFKK